MGLNFFYNIFDTAANGLPEARKTAAAPTSDGPVTQARFLLGISPESRLPIKTLYIDKN